MALLCRMCANLRQQKFPEYCPECELAIDRAKDLFKGMKDEVKVEVDAMDIWMLEKIAIKLDMPLLAILQSIWDHGTQQLIKQHLRLSKVSDE